MDNINTLAMTISFHLILIKFMFRKLINDYNVAIDNSFFKIYSLSYNALKNRHIIFLLINFLSHLIH